MVKRKRKLGGQYETETMDFHWLSSCYNEEDFFFFFLFGSVVAGHENSLFWTPNSIQLRFVFIKFYNTKAYINIVFMEGCHIHDCQEANLP